MKTYAESNSKPPFDWRKALQNALAQEPEEEHYEAMMKLAADWVTCACGNQCEIIPRDNKGAPHDLVLSNAGGNEGFVRALRNRSWDDALNIIELIELRSAYLIKKEIDHHIAILERVGVKVC